MRDVFVDDDVKAHGTLSHAAAWKGYMSASRRDAFCLIVMDRQAAKWFI